MSEDHGKASSSQIPIESLVPFLPLLDTHRIPSYISPSTFYFKPWRLGDSGCSYTRFMPSMDSNTTSGVDDCLEKATLVTYPIWL